MPCTDHSKNSNVQANEQVTQVLHKEMCFKNKFISNFFMLVASSLPVFNIGEAWNPVCRHGDQTVVLILWSTFSRIVLQRIKHF